MSGLWVTNCKSKLGKVNFTINKDNNIESYLLECSGKFNTSLKKGLWNLRKLDSANRIEK